MLSKPDSCRSCVLYGTGHGYVPADGDGTNGVLVVLEAAGENEVTAGIPTVGKAGHYLWSGLNRIGIEREGFTIHNVLSCRPPMNKLAGMPYEAAATTSCAPNLDRTILSARSIAKAHGKTFVIVTLGKTAFKRVMGLTDKSPILKDDYIGYPFWSEQYGAIVIAADHPSFTMRGNHHLFPITQFVFKRALEIANEGITFDTHDYLLDPPPLDLLKWYEEMAAWTTTHSDGVLSYDIETPMKQGKDEEAVSKEMDDDYTILRVSFSYQPNQAVSVPWRAEYLPVLERIFAHPITKMGWNNEKYDSPRVKAQVAVNGDEIDAMLAWHVLNTSMPKGLGFVTPFYAQTVQMWKHLSSDQPAFYNAKDADMALRCYLGIKRDLQANKLWQVFDRHIIQLNRVFAHMSREGVKVDLEMRQEAEDKVSGLLKGVKDRMDTAIPEGVRKLKVYKKTPKDTNGLILVSGERIAKVCDVCKALDVKKDHFKSIGKKRLKAGEPENPCFAAAGVIEKIKVPTTFWAKEEEFKLSNQALLSYQKALRHQAVINTKEQRVTFDEKAIMRLVKKYPKDQLYPLILEFRRLQKLLGTYIGESEMREVEVPDDYVLQPGERWK